MPSVLTLTLLAVAVLSFTPAVEGSFFKRVFREVNRVVHQAEKTISKATKQTVGETQRLTNRVQKTVDKASQQTMNEHGRLMRRAHNEVGNIFPRKTVLGKIVHGTVDLVDTVVIMTAVNAVPGFQFMIRGSKCGPAGNAVMNWFIPDGFQFMDGQVIDFTRACELHDQCYDNGSGKKTCDGQFGAHLKDACRGVSGLANAFCSKIVSPLYEGAVSSLGDSAYLEAQRGAEL